MDFPGRPQYSTACTRLIHLQGDDGGDFQLDPRISFHFQHDARIREVKGNIITISLFNNDNARDNALPDAGTAKSNTFLIDLDIKAMKATLRQEFIDPEDHIYAISQGNSQRLPNEHFIVNHGSTPKIKEFAPDGTCIMTLQFGPTTDNLVYSYRGYKSPWVGLPAAPPSVFACRSHHGTSVYMSWNGATDHQEWLIHAGDNEDSLEIAGKVKKSGFETVGQIPQRAQFVRVEAHGEGILAGQSGVIAVEAKC